MIRSVTGKTGRANAGRNATASTSCRFHPAMQRNASEVAEAILDIAARRKERFAK